MRSALKRRSVRIVAALTLLVLLGCTPLRCGYSTFETSVVVGRGYFDVRSLAGFEARFGTYFIFAPGFFTDHGWPRVPDTAAEWLPHATGRSLSFTAPLYLPALVLLGTLAWMLTRKTPKPGHCLKCGHDLTGNVSGRCSECGEMV